MFEIFPTNTELSLEIMVLIVPCFLQIAIACVNNINLFVSPYFVSPYFWSFFVLARAFSVSENARSEQQTFFFRAAALVH